MPAGESIRKRIQKWEDEDPASLVSERMEKATTSLQSLVALLLPGALIREVAGQTLWAAGHLTDAESALKSLQVASLSEAHACKVERCDAVADHVHKWAVGAAAALGAWDLAGPLGIAPALISLFTLAFRTIRKIGYCYGYDTSSHAEELIVLEILATGSTMSYQDKAQSLRVIRKLHEQAIRNPMTSSHAVVAAIGRLSRPISMNLTKRRSLAAVPAISALVGASTNAWLLGDISWAARNIYAGRRLAEAKDVPPAAKAA